MANFSLIPKDVFERGIIRMTEGGIVTMPEMDVWMTVDEIADMLFVPSAVVFRTIRSIYNNSIARERLAYAIDSHNSQKFRKYIMNRLMGRPMYENVCLTVELPR